MDCLKSNRLFFIEVFQFSVYIVCVAAQSIDVKIIVKTKVTLIYVVSIMSVII